MTGPSLLATDGYKFSMAEAGFPLRRELFYYAHRSGGAQFLPFDAALEVKNLLPTATSDDYAYLAAHEYEMGVGFKSAIVRIDLVDVQALPRGSWFFPREPILSVTGPSALASWIEPLLLQLNYRIQVATLALTEPAALARELGVVTCERQRELVLSTLEAVSVKAPQIRVDSEGYFQRVLERAQELARITGDAGRLFEVGLRAATCIEQHEIALAACKQAGLTRTSHVAAARKLGLVPVGTMGHEHVQRYGSDEAAFRAMRDRRPQRSSYLLDTYDTLKSGIPVAYDLIEEGGTNGDSIRYDSGDKEAQYRFAAAEAARRGIRPVQIIEDGCDAEMTQRLETARREVGYRPEEQFYGYGGYLVAKTMGSKLTRDHVSAVYKLAQSSRYPTMKFANEAGAGKASVPGAPVVFRRIAGDGPIGIIGQAGEAPPEGYVCLTSASEPVAWDGTGKTSIELSSETRALVRELELARDRMLEELGKGGQGKE